MTKFNRYMRIRKTTNRPVYEGGLRTKALAKKDNSASPLVTIVTTVFNAAEHVEQAIKSVLAQTYPAIEYIVVDAASTDGTLDIIKSHESEIDYILSEPDDGIYSGMNKGISLATGEYVIILNADDYFEVNAISLLLEAALDSTAQIVAASIRIRGHSNEDLGLSHSYWNASVYLQSPLRHGTMLVSRDVYERIGTYDESAKVIADRLWMQKAFLHNIKIKILDSPILNFRKAGISSIGSHQHKLEIDAAIDQVAPAIGELWKEKLRQPWNLKRADIENICFEYPEYPRMRQALSVSWRRGQFGTDTPALSVQVPVFNAGLYLKECLDSIRDQTFGNFEVICVDDGSTDDSLSILEDYARKDIRFLVYRSQTNRGTLQARKKAFEEAFGDYMVFVDADDFVAPTMFEELYQQAKKTGADLVQCGVEIYDPKSSLPADLFTSYTNYFSSVPSFEATGKNVFDSLGKYIKYNFCVSLFSRGVYKQVSKYFPTHPMRHGNDNLTMLMLCFFAKKFCTLQRNLYFYRAGENSSNLTVPSVEKVKDHIESRSKVIQYANEFINEVRPELTWDEEPLKSFYISTKAYTKKLLDRCITATPEETQELTLMFTKYFDASLQMSEKSKVSESQINSSSFLAQGNYHTRLGNYDLAKSLYEKAKIEMPGIQHVIDGNIKLIERKKDADYV